ncbi:MAG: 2Fe-2S iron-sulfur cluster binding domain-containing protein, partial [Cytophagia bacterium]|nr:2Fe-2S iron-sulfur cluster binding domain-containing protein [Cytophagia bacterium]
MIKLKINSKEIEVKKGSTILQAANSLGIKIPTMCYLEGQSNHPSCMMCVVKDLNTNQLHPSCAMKVAEGMN